MCIVCTSRVGFRGPHGLDITVKSSATAGAGRILAPTWAMVGGVKGWKDYEALPAQQYTRLYYDLLRERFRQSSLPFLNILAQDRVVLLCYCRSDVFCHRHLAVDILEKIAQAGGLPFTRGGELSIQ